MFEKMVRMEPLVRAIENGTFEVAVLLDPPLDQTNVAHKVDVLKDPRTRTYGAQSHSA